MSELKHHGIQGMHWGQRNGPPYPLSRSISTGKRLKTFAKNRKLKKDLVNEYGKEGKKLYKNIRKLEKATDRINDAYKYVMDNEGERETNRLRGRYNPDQIYSDLESEGYLEESYEKGVKAYNKLYEQLYELKIYDELGDKTELIDSWDRFMEKYDNYMDIQMEAMERGKKKHVK